MLYIPLPLTFGGVKSSHPKKTHKHRKTKIKATEISQSNGPTNLVSDETIYEEREDRMERTATTASSLKAEQDSGNIIRTQSMATLNEPIPQGTGSCSGPRRQDTILGDKPAQTSVPVITASPTRPVDDSITDDITLAETLMKIKSSASRPQKAKGVMFKEPILELSYTAELKRRKVLQNIEEELAQRLQAQEQGEFTIEEGSKLFVELKDKRKKHFAKLRAEEQRRKPPTKTQKRNQISTYLKNMAGYKHTQLKSKSYDEIQKLFDKEMKRVKTFMAIDSEVVEGSGKKAESSGKEAVSKKREGEKLSEESVKRQKVEDGAEKTKLKVCLEIVLEDKMYYEIIKADGSTKYYKIFSAMLDDFDRQDVLDLYRLVNERFETTSLEGYDRLLWGDLITLFEPSEEDEIWKAQQDYTLISWRLYDSCGVHLLLMDTGITIHMLVEKNYPLTQEMLSRMLSRRLEVDYESEMAFELLRFTRSQLKK
ncbi:hypothetical protein Tco_0700559 [Tanacetum coccineum]